jgi:uroporphyrinogen decarboxylase
MQSMSHRERVVAALAHRQPDRVPIDLGTTVVTGIALKTYDRLKAHLGLDLGDAQVYDRRNQLAIVDDAVLDRFDIDTRSLQAGAPENRPIIESTDQEGFTDEWGSLNVKPPDVDTYFIANAPLSGEISLHDIINYPWPDPDDPGRTRGLRARALALRAKDDRALVMAIPGSIIQMSQLLRGFEDWYMDVAANPELIGALLDQIQDVQTSLAGNLLGAVIFIYDDLAMQDRLVVSFRHYQRLIEPRLRKYIEFLHSRTPAKIVHHNDGAIMPVLDSLIDMGIDAINPVQVSAKGMGDVADLKRRFGARLAFWGAVDTQTTLPFGTPADVRAEVLSRIRDLNRDGGYVLGAVHNIQADIPEENVVALFETARDEVPGGEKRRDPDHAQATA